MSSNTIVKITTPDGITYDQPTGLFINNEFAASKSGKKFAVENPASEGDIVDIYEAEEADVEAAIDAAEAAFKTWSVEKPSIRGQVLIKLADKMEDHREVLRSIESMDNGKTLQMADGDVSLAINTIRIFGGWADKNHSDVIETGEDFFNFTRYEPIGVYGQIIPWNFPLAMWSWKVGPALATGNTVVLKSAESTPLSALYVSQLAKEVGIPAGVMNIISGYGKTGQLLSTNMRIKKIAFTGSTATGRRILKAAADSNLKTVTLELGGKSPNIVFDDADLEKAFEHVNFGIYFNSGQACTAGSRIYVQEGIYDKFLQLFKARAEKNVVGDPTDPKTFYGPQTSKIQLDHVLNYIEEGKKEGAKLVTGGERLPRKGYFVSPTIFSDVTADMKIVKEEIFGPITTITKFRTDEEVIGLANDSEYGLAAGIHTTNINRAINVSKKLQAGTVWVTYNAFEANVPFGGYKQSGIGRELGRDALANYLQTKAVRVVL